MRIFFILLIGFFSQACYSQKLLILGDSLSAAYGMQQQQGWPHLLQQQQSGWQLVNASISGETTQGALARLPDGRWLLVVTRKKGADAGQGGNARQPVQKRGVQQPGARRKAFAWLCCKACQPGEVPGNVPGNVPGVRPAVPGLLAGFSQQLFRWPFRLPFGQCVRALWLGLGCVAFVSGPVCGEAMHGSPWA